MDLSCIISSGDLELFVLGLLPEEESARMVQLIKLFPELQEEIDRITECLQNISSESPRPEVKQKILNEIGMDKSFAKDRSAEFKSEEKAKVVPFKKSSLLMAASFTALLISLGVIAFLHKQTKDADQKLAALEQKVDSLNNNISRQKEQYLASVEMMRIMQDDNYTGIKLMSMPGKPEAMVKVFWNKKSNEVYLMDISLPSPPSQKQYQLWAIVDGKPVNAGMLEDNKERAQRMVPFTKADAFAITLENKGGSATPTMEELYVMGKVS